jgi:hypothetical protein
MQGNKDFLNTFFKEVLQRSLGWIKTKGINPPGLQSLQNTCP